MAITIRPKDCIAGFVMLAAVSISPDSAMSRQSVEEPWYEDPPTIYWSCDWDYDTGENYNAIACGAGGTSPWAGYDYNNYNTQKWHTASIGTDIEYTQYDQGNVSDPGDESLVVVSNPPAGCPTSNALKMTWKFRESIVGSWLAGTDSNIYQCKLSHTSAVDGSDRPITGANWATYWQADEYGRTTANPLTGAWQAGRQYYAKNVAGSNTCSMYAEANYLLESPPYSSRWEMANLPNPWYHRFYFYSESYADYAEGGRKLAYWDSPDGTKVSMLEAYNMEAGDFSFIVGLPPEGYDHRAYLCVHKRPGTNLSRWNHYEDIKMVGLTTQFGGSGQPATGWPDCPETGAHTSQGILEINAWNCIEFAQYSHHTDGWVRVWLNGQLCIHCCKEAWGLSEFNTLAHTDGGEDRYHSRLTFPHERNGGPVIDCLEYTAAHVVSDTYIGPTGFYGEPRENFAWVDVLKPVTKRGSTFIKTLRGDAPTPIIVGAEFFTQPASKPFVSDPVTYIDFYSEMNCDTTQTMTPNSGGYSIVGQSFTGDGRSLNSAYFFLRKNGLPTGNLYAKLYAETHWIGFGTDSQPTGVALAVSDAMDASTLSTTFEMVGFTFSTPYTLNLGTNYCITLEYPTNPTSDYIRFGTDFSAPTHSGNHFLYDGSWYTVPAGDMLFYATSNTLSFNVTVASVRNAQSPSAPIYGTPSSWVDILRPVRKRIPWFIRMPREHANPREGEVQVSNAVNGQISTLPTITQGHNITLLDVINLQTATGVSFPVETMGFVSSVLTPCDELSPHLGRWVVAGAGLPSDTLSLWHGLHYHEATSPSITGDHNIVTDSGTDSQAATSPTNVEVKNFLPLSDTNAQVATSPTLTLLTSQTADSTVHAQTATNPLSIIEVFSFAPNACVHAQVATLPMVAEGITIVDVISSANTQTAGSPVITQLPGEAVPVNSTIHLHTATPPTIVVIITQVAVSNDINTQTATQPVLAEAGTFAPSNTTHAQSAMRTSLNYKIDSANARNAQASTSPTITIGLAPVHTFMAKDVEYYHRTRDRAVYFRTRPIGEET